jgi:hypothetical protein
LRHHAAIAIPRLLAYFLSMSVNTMIPISPAAHKTLLELARQANTSVEAVLHEAIETRRRQVFLERTNQAFAALREDQASWADYAAEVQAWEATLGDGL